MLATNYLRKTLHTVLIGFASVTCVLSMHAHAKNELSKKVGTPLAEAQSLLKANKYKEALSKVREAEAVSGKTAIEEKTVNQMLAQIYFTSKDYANGAAVYETMLAKGQFDGAEVNKQIKVLSQIYMSLKNYPKALQYSERYLKEAGADSEVSRQVAQIYVFQGDNAKAADLAAKYIKSTSASGKTASEDWYKILMKSLFDLGKKTEYADAIEQTLAVYPNNTYWDGMITATKAENSFNDRQSIILARLKDQLGVATGADYIAMAELCIASANPGDAKAALEKGFAKGLLSGDREKKLLARATTDAAGDLSSLGNIEKQAASAANGESLVRIGEAYLGHGQYVKAIELIGKGLAKGGVSFKDDATINLGIAYLMAAKQPEALKAFKSVPANSKVGRLARLWAVHAAKTK